MDASIVLIQLSGQVVLMVYAHESFLPSRRVLASRAATSCVTCITHDISPAVRLLRALEKAKSMHQVDVASDDTMRCTHGRKSDP